MAALTESTRRELRQVLGANVANQVLEVLDAASDQTQISRDVVADVLLLKRAEDKHLATVETLVQSHMQLSQKLDQLAAEVKSMRDPPVPVPVPDPVPAAAEDSEPVSPPVDLTDISAN